MDVDTINLLLEKFRECARRGDQARLFLETRNGDQFGTLTVRIPGDPPGPTSPLRTCRRKSPSTVRRNQERLRTFLKKKASLDPLGSSSYIGPTSLKKKRKVKKKSLISRSHQVSMVEYRANDRLKNAAISKVLFFSFYFKCVDNLITNANNQVFCPFKTTKFYNF